MSLYKQIFESGLRQHETGVALRCDGEAFTFKEVEQKIKEKAKRFEELGIGKNSKVVLKIRHPLTFSLTLLTLTYLEAVPMPIYHGMGKDKLTDLCKTYDVNYVITSTEDQIFSGEDCPRTEVSDCMCYELGKKLDFLLEGVRLILFTSGTTSTPKAIMLTEDNICSNVCSISEYLKLTTKDNLLLIKDLSHSSSIIGELFVGLYNGCSVILTTKLLRVVTILSLMQENHITTFFAVPTLLKDIMSYKKRAEYDISALRIINFYGASMNQNDIINLMNLFSDVNVIYSYGQTEASPRVTYIEREMLEKHPASCGKPISGVSLAIVGDENRECVPFEKGEIVVQGPNVMRGYYRNEKKTHEVIREGKLYTGDLGYRDEEGFLYVVGRKDNMFIRAGKNIYPEEIEGVLQSHEDILQSLVLPENRSNDSLDIIAYIVLKENHEFDPDKLWEYCKIKLEDYKVPKEFRVVAELQKTASGKIKRNQFL